ncbi:hypothetical protein SAY87_018633 [Trapa incisa]|uniref:Tyrosine-specific transport protein n=1 Tax=Trapa incisa TaxID=236973 RepID=A0AAN7K179_9MYRT|nr:hypothetical protein SAY87_018633 [Trapa incisa]
MLLHHHLHSRPNSAAFSRFSTFFGYNHRRQLCIVPFSQRVSTEKPQTLFLSPARFRGRKDCSFSTRVGDPQESEAARETIAGKNFNFWGAVSLIIGTAVGPGMLGLPALTIRSGPFPSSIAILLSWVYVISSIILVAELTFAAMEEDGAEEVSFTSLAIKSLGSRFGAFVAIIYASLSFALLVACVSGIGSIIAQWCPSMNLMVAYALFPLAVGIILEFFPFKAIDSLNRSMCLLMLISITALVGIGLSVARANVVSSFSYSSWSVSSILPAIPVTVLTLGFHVITPFICKIAGETVAEARKAVLVGGAVPLVMVLSWNLIVLGLSGGSNSTASSADPISLLLSVNPTALSAVQGFAFSALATSLIGYAVSFPRQLLDTFDLIFQKNDPIQEKFSKRDLGKSGIVEYDLGISGIVEYDLGKSGRASFSGEKCLSTSEKTGKVGFGSINEGLIIPIVLGAPILIAFLFPSTFSKALDFAGVYANCFLFGILPPLMAYIQLSRKKLRSTIVPGGNASLFLLFTIAVALVIWH